MKAKMSWFLCALLLIVFLTGCSHVEPDFENIKTSEITVTPQDTSTVTPTLPPPTISPTLLPTQTPSAQLTEPPVSITPAPTPNEDQFVYDTNPKIIKKDNGDEVLKCKYVNLTITFPKSWSGKYLIHESEDGLGIYFKPDDLAPITSYEGEVEYPLIRIIERVTPVTNTDEMICDSPIFFSRKGVHYLMYGPTDFQYPLKGPEVETFKQMLEDVTNIVLNAD